MFESPNCLKFSVNLFLTFFSFKKSTKFPSNGIEFTRDWRRSCTTSGDKYDFLLELGGEKLAKIFKAEISFGLLGDFLNCLHSEFNVKDIDEVTSVLEGLTRAGRFDLSLTFLSSQETETAEKLFDKLEEVLKSSETSDNEDVESAMKEFNADKLKLLKEKYKIKS